MTHIITGIQSELAQLKSTVSSLTNRLQITEEQLKQFRRNEYKVAFGATLGSTDNFGPFNTPVTLVYNNVYLNEGRAYNPNNGIFTAPVKGAYYFSFSGHNRSSKVLNLGLFKNGEQMVILFNHPLGNRYESTANSISLTLEKGDHVYVRLPVFAAYVCNTKGGEESMTERNASLPGVWCCQESAVLPHHRPLPTELRSSVSEG
ncbi:hypothetical protein QQF64_015344 [Cirrhinus molitorella]|uniref:C1q domain-containing protein n=1 Tax=Cirrhinus molitorella TaxID=172907 RepID=A0ABR3NUY9_9TELE